MASGFTRVLGVLIASACGDTLARTDDFAVDAGTSESDGPHASATGDGGDADWHRDSGAGASDGDASDGPTSDASPGTSERCAALHISCGYLPHPRATGFIDCGPCEVLDLRRVPMYGNDLVADGSRGLLYVSTSERRDSPAEPPPGPNPGAVLAIDPMTGAEVAALRFDVLADDMAMTDDGSRLYVVLGDGREIAFIDLSTFTLAGTFAVLEDEPMGHGRAERVVAIPGQTRTVLVTTRDGNSLRPSAIAVHDDTGARRPDFVRRGDEHAHVLTAASSAVAFAGGSFERLLTLSIDELGIRSEREDRLEADIGEIFEGGLLFSQSWTVIDPFLPAVLGRYDHGLSSAAGLVPEQATDRVYSLRRTDGTAPGYDLVSFTRAERAPVSEVHLPPEDVTGVPGHLVRWGDRGLAFLEHDWAASDQALVILTTTQVEPPW